VCVSTTFPTWQLKTLPTYEVVKDFDEEQELREVIEALRADNGKRRTLRIPHRTQSKALGRN
jgi:hypothetical protein